MRHRVAASLRTGFFGLGALFPASQRGPSAADIRSWPGWNGGECPVCGAFAGNGPTGGTLSACASCATIPPFKFARSLFAYEGSVRDAILAMKYARQSVPAEALAKRLLEAVAGKWADRFPAGYRPAVVPVPIGPLRYFHRGFNLPGLIARSLARLAGWPFSPLALRRHGGNPQAGRCLAEREQNVRGAFSIPAGRRPPPEIVLVDDVYTSGATARACSRALKSGGAAHIVVLTVARTVL